ncbi:MAG: spermidine synthase [SAR86 cluster bacterium]|uniref:Polyamine aminopropyltransferase n=1 Tax=SAR86 cluster bacterium TaxID=2030880 RepID=A0A2A4MQH3_9GAMM|nr:MAG: spermidine synthase [SAR86 cluster bacterium]
MFNKSIVYRDWLLIGVMAIGAACGMIYEYLIAHYAGRILGSVDTAIYSMIGIMVVSMGIGAFYSRTIKCPYTGFALLEILIALIGGCSVLFMAALFSMAYVLPLQLQHSFGIDDSILIQGGAVFIFQQSAQAMPYITGLVLGTLIGMEIPFIARIREDVYAKKLENNVGTVYGADYIGAGVGAAIWVFICLQLPIILSAAYTALLNVILGMIFLAHFRSKIRKVKWLATINVGVALILISIAFNGVSWMNAMSNMLYEDSVVYSNNTPYQNLVITERIASNDKPSIINLYINGNLQFSSSDESLYHGMLVKPTLLASARQQDILIIGGGDGLAARDAFKLGAEKITLIDLDPDMIALFQGKSDVSEDWLNQRLLQLNENSLNDARLNIVYGDAFKIVEIFAAQQRYFDAIIVDLPDPNHPDLNKLYSDYFYAKLGLLLSADGVINVQSTSPYHSKKAFISIGKTMAQAGLTVQQYHTNVPSFGEWGWSIASKQGLAPLDRINQLASSIPPSVLEEAQGLSLEQINAAFVFSPLFFQDKGLININYLGEPVVYNYHAEGWRIDKGIYYAE